MARSNHTDQRFRDETNLIRLVEHLQRAHDDASAVGSAEALLTKLRPYIATIED